MKKRLICLFVVCLVFTSGCMSVPFIKSNPPPLGVGKTQAWYGRVNKWDTDKEALKSDLQVMGDSNVDGYMIEMAGWADPNAWTDKWLSEKEDMYVYLLEGCRYRGLWLFVSIVNDNMGTGKYGDSGIPLATVYSKAQKLVDIVKKHGKDNVIVQPVAETRTTAGKNMEQYCIQQLGSAGFPLVYNGGSRPSSIPGGFSFRAWHPFKTTDNPPRDVLCVSDTGTIINILDVDTQTDTMVDSGSVSMLGYGLDGKAKPDVLEAWAKKIKGIGCPVVGYYAFQLKDHDKAGIQALGKGVK